MFSMPPVGQVQQLQSEKRAVGRQVGSSVEVTQEVSALCPCWTSGALWGPAALRDTAEIRRPPAPEGQAHALSSMHFSRWRLPKRCTDVSRGAPCSLRGSAIVGRQPHLLPRTGVNRAIRDSMARQIHTCSSPERQCHRRRQVLLRPN